MRGILVFGGGPMLIGLYVIILVVLAISAVFGIAFSVMGAWDIFIEKRRTAWQWFALVGGAFLVATAAPLIIYFFSLSREEFESNLNRVKGDGVRVVYPDTKKADVSPPFDYQGPTLAIQLILEC